MPIYNWIFVLFTKRLLHVFALTALFSFLRTICCCKIVTLLQLQSMKYIICGGFTESFTAIQIILARCCGLKVFFNIENPCLKYVATRQGRATSYIISQCYDNICSFYVPNFSNIFHFVPRHGRTAKAQLCTTPEAQLEDVPKNINACSLRDKQQHGQYLPAETT